MGRSGRSGAFSLSFVGRAALDPLAEVDLEIDAAEPAEGDPLTTGPIGSPLVVTAAVSWTGRTASESA